MTGATVADVAVVGFGPVGTVLAGLLGRRGIDVVVVDRDGDVFPLPRAAHVDHTGLRTIQELGCLDEVLSATIPNPGIDFLGADGDVVMRVPASQATSSGVPTSVYFHQPGFDRALRSAVSALPSVNVRLRSRLVSLEQTPDGAGLRLRNDGAAGDELLSARHVVGCDGASSTVRELLGLPLRDLGYHERWLVLDLLLRDRGRLPDRAVYVCRPGRPHVLIPMPGRRHRIEVKLLAGEQAATVEGDRFGRELLRPYVDPDTVEVERAAVYAFHGLVAERWRDGSVLLAGDAAHQMPPFLGQGMCSGIRDAANLAWKLEHRLRHGAPESLLDTYQAEREPHVEAIIRSAIAYGEIVGTLDPAAAAARDARLRKDHSELVFGLPPLGPGPLVGPGGGGLFVQPECDGVPLDTVVGPRFLVVGRDMAALGRSGRWWTHRLGARVVTLPELGSAAPAVEQWMERRAAAVVVVRPDRYVLAAGPGPLDELTGDVAPLLAG
jgi:3-(3-hydroxy-phenyl)propionate hydroxylase